MTIVPDQPHAALDSSARGNAPTHEQPAPDSAGLSLLATLGLAAYLGISWTWCIGMFLPILLIRDFGLWSFAVFALPNILGAAALGWTIRTPGHAHALRAAHAPMIRLFSLVTIAFQAFFLMNIVPAVPPFAAVAAVLVTLTLGEVASRAIDRRAHSTAPAPPAALFSIPALLLWLASAAVLIIGLTNAYSARDSTLLGALRALPVPALPTLHLVPLGAVCVLGFALCPLLDATFISGRAVASTPASAKGAFAVGFGVIFFSMLVGTLWYAPLYLRDGGFPLLVALHLLAQLGFTIGCHTRRFAAFAPGAAESVWTPGVIIALGAGVLLAFAANSLSTLLPATGLSNFELVYRLFMTFYALIFPAYVACNLRLSRNAAPPAGARRHLWLLAILLAAPCYALGFLNQQTWWLIPGVAIVLITAACARRSPQPASLSQ
ncbi:hypothetical protein BH11PLA1_BH11PLA1_23540 [soil metagenome]